MKVYNSFSEMATDTGALQQSCLMSVFNRDMSALSTMGVINSESPNGEPPVGTKEWLKKFQELAGQQSRGEGNNAQKILQMSEQANDYWGQKDKTQETVDEKLMRGNVASAIRDASQLPGIKHVPRQGGK